MNHVILIVMLTVIVLAGTVVYAELFYRPAYTYSAEESARECVLEPLHVETLGVDDSSTDDPPPREAILLLHGSYGSAAMWEHVIEVAWPDAERKEFQIVMPDLLGHGKSSKSASIDYSVKQHVDSLVDVLRRYVPPGRPLHIAGFSIGAPIAVALSARLVRTLSPWPLRSLTLVAPAYFPTLDRHKVLEGLRAFHKNFALPNTTYLLGRFVIPPIRSLLTPLAQLIFPHKFPISTHRRSMIHNAFQTDLHGLARSAESMVVRYDVDAGLHTLRNVDVPILVIDSSRDTIRSNDPERVQLLRAAGPRARHVIVDGGHTVIAKEPEKVIDPLKAFIISSSVSNVSPVRPSVTGKNHQHTDDQQLTE